MSPVPLRTLRMRPEQAEYTPDGGPELQLRRPISVMPKCCAGGMHRLAFARPALHTGSRCFLLWPQDFYRAGRGWQPWDWRRAAAPMQPCGPARDLRRGADCAPAARRTGADLRRRAQSGVDAAAAGCSGPPQIQATFFCWAAAPGGAGTGAAHRSGGPPDRESFLDPSELGAHGGKPSANELARTSETLEQIRAAGAYFRPPFGARRPAVFRMARQLGMRAVLWNAMTSDWSERSAEELLSG